MLITELHSLLEAYNTRYNCQFHLTPRYSLYPKPREYGWEQTWPNHDCPGVYIITDSEEEIIYVGTSEVLGRRFYEWFGSGKSCELKHNWKHFPSYLYTIATNLWERLSLEAYLIHYINPKENSLFRIK